jgi:hypothetical protein
VAGGAGRVVEDRPKPGAGGKTPLELGVTARKRRQLGGREPLHRTVEHVAVGSGLGG